MAPEQIAGDPVDHRADIYALGCLLHFVLTGQPPSPATTTWRSFSPTANAPRPRPSEFLPALPTTLDRVVAQAMAVSPERRYQTRPAGRRPGAGRSRRRASAAGLPAASAAASDRAVTRRLPRPAAPAAAVVAASLALIAAAAVAALVLIVAGRRAARTVPTNPHPHAVDTVDVGGPSRLAVAPSAAVGGEQRRLGPYAIDLLTGQQARPPLPDRGQPDLGRGRVPFGLGAERGSNALLRLDPLHPPVEIRVGIKPTDVAVDRHGVWVANRGNDTVSRVDPDTNTVDSTVEVGAAPTAVATGAGGVWVANAATARCRGSTPRARPS